MEIKHRNLIKNTLASRKLELLSKLDTYISRHALATKQTPIPSRITKIIRYCAEYSKHTLLVDEEYSKQSRESQKSMNKKHFRELRAIGALLCLCL